MNRVRISTEKCCWGFLGFFFHPPMAENEDKWLPFCSLMQKEGAIIVEMQLLDALLQLFLCVCVLLFFYSIISACPTFTQPTHLRSVHKSRPCMENQPLSAVKAKCPGSCPDPLILSQAPGREPDEAGRKGCTTKRKNGMPIKEGDCIKQTK